MKNFTSFNKKEGRLIFNLLMREYYELKKLKKNQAKGKNRNTFTYYVTKSDIDFCENILLSFGQDVFGKNVCTLESLRKERIRTIPLDVLDLIIPKSYGRNTIQKEGL
jgi:hypothetical protein